MCVCVVDVVVVRGCIVLFKTLLLLLLFYCVCSDGDDGVGEFLFLFTQKYVLKSDTSQTHACIKTKRK